MLKNLNQEKQLLWPTNYQDIQNTHSQLHEQISLKQQLNINPFVCNTCFDLAQTPVLAQCGHIYCWKCIRVQMVDTVLVCSVCFEHISVQKMRPIYISGEEQKNDHQHTIKLRPKPQNSRPIPFQFYKIHVQTQTVKNPQQGQQQCRVQQCYQLVVYSIKKKMKISQSSKETSINKLRMYNIQQVNYRLVCQFLLFLLFWVLYQLVIVYDNIIIYFSVYKLVRTKQFNIILKNKIEAKHKQHIMNPNPQDQDRQNFNKIIVVGDAGVGKTNIIYVFDKGRKPLAANPTIGVQFTSKIVPLSDGRKVRAQIWDTAGQEQFRAVTMIHYREAVGALVVFDLTNRYSFEHARQWITSVTQRADPTVQIILVGHKSDTTRRAVSKSEAQQLAKSYKILYTETTTNDPETIHATFLQLLTRVADTQKRNIKNGAIRLESSNGQNQSGCKC